MYPADRNVWGNIFRPGILYFCVSLIRIKNLNKFSSTIWKFTKAVFHIKILSRYNINRSTTVVVHRSPRIYVYIISWVCADTRSYSVSSWRMAIDRGSVYWPIISCCSRGITWSDTCSKRHTN